MKIYVAGASAEMARAESMIAVLRGNGFEVPFDWTEPVKRHGHANDVSPTVADAESTNALRHVENVDAVVCLVPPVGVDTIGLWVELGVAFALRGIFDYPHVMIVAPAGASLRDVAKRSIMFARADTMVASEADALVELEAMRGARRVETLGRRYAARVLSSIREIVRGANRLSEVLSEHAR